jgi:hypothetical protein
MHHQTTTLATSVHVGLDCARGHHSALTMNAVIAHCESMDSASPGLAAGGSCRLLSSRAPSVLTCARSGWSDELRDRCAWGGGYAGFLSSLAEEL